MDSTIDFPQYIEALIDARLGSQAAAVYPAVRAALRDELSARVVRHMNASILAAMPPEKLEGLESALASDTPATVQAYIAANVPDIDGVIDEALRTFREIYLQG